HHFSALLCFPSFPTLLLDLLYHKEFYRSSIFVLFRSILRQIFVVQNSLEQAYRFRHGLHTEFLSQDACTELVLAQCVAAAALGSIGSHKLLVCHLLTAVLLQNSSDPSHGILVATSLQVVFGQRSAHRQIDL